MKLCIQRVKEASVTVQGKRISQIDSGLLIFIGISKKDNKQIVDEVVKKIIHLRIFEDENNKMNLSLKDIDGEVLIVSQFTLYADCNKGNRPSFIESANYKDAEILYNYFIEKFKQSYNDTKVKTGEFGEDMQVSIINDGPVTIILEK